MPISTHYSTPPIYLDLDIDIDVDIDIDIDARSPSATGRQHSAWSIAH
jgi:hypothetical protein